MIDIHADEYWTGQFDITLEDLDRTAGRLARYDLPQDLKALALPIIQGRLVHGHDSSLSAPGGLEDPPAIRFWDPAHDWQVGDVVLLVHDRYGFSKYELFLGEIISLNIDEAKIKIEELGCTKSFLRTLPCTANAQLYPNACETWQTILQDVVETKLRSSDLQEQAEGLLLKYGGSLLTRLSDALRQDTRFTGFEGSWCLTDRLPGLEPDTLQTLHHFLLQNQRASLDDLLPVVQENSRTNSPLIRMAVYTALARSPERFENIGTATMSQWQARLPAHDQAEVTHFAFDPQTFEVLCRPGQRLTRKKARRLQELNLYAHVVTFPEWHLPARQ